MFSRANGPAGLAGSLRVLALLGILAAGFFSPALSAAPVELRVMTFNIRWDGLDRDSSSWEQRKAGVVALLRKHAPDAFSLQEASPSQTQFLKNSLSNYRFFLSTHERAVYLPIFFREDRFRLDSHGSFWLVEESELQGGTRRCAWVRLVEKHSGRGLYIFNLHLDGRSPSSHELSVVELTRELSKRRFKDPVLVMGDFNAVETRPSISFVTGKTPLRDENGRVLVNAIALRDAVREIFPAGKAPGTAHGFKGNLDGPRIDYIFVSDGITVRDVATVSDSMDGRFPSDHFPVVADIALSD
jgi:endonuclease/exonuclease/phosphatase family metal-dependent hydrolase